MKTRAEQLWAAFEKFHRKNPHIFVMFEEYAARVQAAGFNKYGAKTIYENLRYALDVQVIRTGGKRIKLNNNYVPFYARLYHQAHPDRSDFFNLRKLITENRPAYKKDIQEWPDTPADDSPSLQAKIDSLLY